MTSPEFDSISGGESGKELRLVDEQNVVDRDVGVVVVFRRDAERRVLQLHLKLGVIAKLQVRLLPGNLKQPFAPFSALRSFADIKMSTPKLSSQKCM
jgi:hypothetical protein